MKAGRCAEAVSTFEQLQSSQGLDGRPDAMLAYGHALEGVGAHVAAQSTFLAALAAKPDVQVQGEID